MKTKKVKVGQVRLLSVSTIRPAPENDKVYRPIDPMFPDVQSLANDIRELGILVPLVVSADGWLLSGHRRLVAAKLTGLTEVPCMIDPVRRDREPDRFMRLLVAHNKQRVKSFDEALREEILMASEDDKATAVFNYRRDRAAVNLPPMELREAKARKRISEAKALMLEAIDDILDRERQFWPMTARRIHYHLLSSPPRRHVSKPGSSYANDDRSYGDLTDLLARARLTGRIPWDAIDDETRPVEVWTVHSNPSTFLQEELDGFLKGYWRNLLQSQPNWIEIVTEKNGIVPIIRPVAMEYTIPLTSGHGYASLSPRRAMAQRFRKSGKEKLIVLFLSDFDPDGREISHSFAASMRDDFGIADLVPIQVALTVSQIKKFGLPPLMRAKKTSANYRRFANEYGDDVWELDALKTADLQAVLREAIEGVIDRQAFTHETEQEAQDLARLHALRQQVKQLLAGVNIQ
jgi:ParB-like chromosome segregation protein Spo0J